MATEETTKRPAEEVATGDVAKKTCPFKVDTSCGDPSPCTYSTAVGNGKSPHVHETDIAKRFTGPSARILDSIADHIGFTPLVRCERLAKHLGIECELLAKC